MPNPLSYRASATAEGGGDASRVTTQDGALDLALVTPQDLGGPGGDGTNAEQLLAAGYAACLLSALRYAALQRGMALPEDARVEASVEVASREQGRFGVQIALRAAIPSLSDEATRELVEAAREAWPYAQSRIDGEAIAVEAGSERSGAARVEDARAQAAEGRGYGG